jgi:hypothetical protein
MPISFDLASVDGIAIGIGQGTLSLDEMKLAVTNLWRRMSGPRYFILWDLLDARMDLTRSEVRELADFITGHEPEGEIRTAFVVSGDLEFGLVRMFEVFRESEGAQTFVFRDRQAAIDWLRPGDPRE